MVLDRFLPALAQFRLLAAGFEFLARLLGLGGFGSIGLGNGLGAGDDGLRAVVGTGLYCCDWSCLAFFAAYRASPRNFSRVASSICLVLGSVAFFDNRWKARARFWCALGGCIGWCLHIGERRKIGDSLNSIFVALLQPFNEFGEFVLWINPVLDLQEGGALERIAGVHAFGNHAGGVRDFLIAPRLFGCATVGKEGLHLLPRLHAERLGDRVDGLPLRVHLVVLGLGGDGVGRRLVLRGVLLGAAHLVVDERVQILDRAFGRAAGAGGGITEIAGLDQGFAHLVGVQALGTQDRAVLGHLALEVH